jgi:transcriptional regulator with XRE-family HTH domain
MLEMAEPSPTRLGAKLRQLRESLGLSLRQVQEKTQISGGHLSLIETGQVRNPSPTILHRLAAVYKTNPQDLLVLAGYLKPKDNMAKRTAGASIALASMRDLDEDDLQQVQTLIQVLRSRKQAKSKRVPAGK